MTICRHRVNAPAACIAMMMHAHRDCTADDHSPSCGSSRHACNCMSNFLRAHGSQYTAPGATGNLRCVLRNTVDLRGGSNVGAQQTHIRAAKHAQRLAPPGRSSRSYIGHRRIRLLIKTASAVSPRREKSESVPISLVRTCKILIQFRIY